MNNYARRSRLNPDVTLALPDGPTSNGSDDRSSPAQAIMEATREPLLLLDRELHVTAANRAFCLTFGLGRRDVVGRPVQELGDGQWNIPELRALLKRILLRYTTTDDYEIERNFSGVGRRTMLLHARKVVGVRGSNPGILLAIEDITERRATVRALRDLVQERNALAREEIPDRIATSLQIVASVLRAGARTAGSEETRRHLEDAHNRVMDLSALQRSPKAPDTGAKVMVGPYLSRLCEILAPVGPGGARPVSVQVLAEPGAVDSGQAVSIGLAATELVVNALEHAFPDAQDDGMVLVTYEQDGSNWTLTVSDNGVGPREDLWDRPYPGLGTMVVEAMARRLDAYLEFAMDMHGTTVSIAHGAPFASWSTTADPGLHRVRKSDGLGQAEQAHAMPELRPSIDI